MIRKSMTVKKIAAGILSFALCLSNADFSYASSETLAESLNTGLIQLDDMGADSDELFEGYIYSQFYGDYGISAFGMMAGDELDESSKRIYDRIKPEIAKVASGTRSSTKFTVSVKDLLNSKLEYTPDELYAGGQIVSNGALTPEADNAVNRLFVSSAMAAVNALRMDCPYEMYWFGNAFGFEEIPFACETDESGNEKIIFDDKDVSIVFLVSSDYRGADEFTTSSQKLSSVSAAVNNAQSIVSAAEGKSDLEKLKYYRDRICELTSYNSAAADASMEAAANGAATEFYGDPWQMIWVFDNNPETNVVCEGYAKAFQYLCDSSTFEGDIYSYIVTGYLVMPTGPGLHMWNVVHMDNGKNYIADVTNSDAGSTGIDDLFLKPVSTGSADTGYFVSGSQKQAGYIYDQDTMRAYSAEELNLTTDIYHKYGQGHMCSIDGCGDIQNGVYGFSGANLTIGDMISLNFHVALSDEASADENSYMLFTFEDGTEKRVYLRDLSAGEKNGNIYTFRCPLYSTQMRENVKAKMVFSNDISYREGTEGYSFTYSIQDYTNRMLEKETTSAELKTALKDMMNFGEYAHNYKESSYTLNLYEGTTADVTVDNAYAGTVTAADVSGISAKSANLHIDSLLSIKVQYELEEGHDIDEYIFKVDGRIAEAENIRENVYEVKIGGLMPADYEKMYSVTVEPVSGGSVQTVRYGVLSYVKNMLGKSESSDAVKTLCRSLYHYYASVKAYAESVNHNGGNN